MIHKQFHRPDFIWTPDAVTPEAWYDASDADSLTLSGSDVTQWDDKSGNGRHAIGDATKPPSVDGDSVYFDGTNSEFMRVPPASVNFGNATIFTVGEISADNTYLLGSSGGDAGANSRVYIRRDFVIMGRFDGSQQDRVDWTTATSDKTLRVLLSSDAPSPLDLEAFANGTSDGTDLAYTHTGPTPPDQLYFGCRNSAAVEGVSDNYNGFMTGKIYEVIIMPETDTVTRQRIEGYLAWKWDMQDKLPESHPYRFNGFLFGYGWNPGEISSSKIMIWLDGADPATMYEDAGTDPVEDADPIYQWNDKSGNGNHAVQTVVGERPTYSASGQEATFDGGDIMDVTNDPFKDIHNFAVCHVGRWGATSAWNNTFAAYYGEGGVGWKTRQYSSSFDKLTFTRRGTAGADDPNPTTTTNNVDFIGASIRVNSNQSIIRHNGTETYDSGTSDTGSITYSGSNRSSIGGGYSADNWTTATNFLSNGSAIKELIVIENFTTSELLKVEGYLAWKWGLEDELPATHRYKNNGEYFGVLPAPWTPAQLTLESWFDADDYDSITESGGAVSGWDDQEGLRNVTQTTGSLQPTYQATGFDGGTKPCIYFDGTEGLDIASVSGSSMTNMSVFAVVDDQYVSGYDYLTCFGKGGTGEWRCIIGENTHAVKMRQSGANSDSFANTTGEQILSWEFDYTGQNANIFKDGVSKVTDTSFTMAYTDYDGQYTIGGRSPGGDTFTGKIAEIVIVPSVLSTADRQKMEGYLAHKWGLEGSLDSGHPYKSAAPTV